MPVRQQRFWKGISQNSRASTWRVASLTRRASSRFIGFVALRYYFSHAWRRRVDSAPIRRRGQTHRSQGTSARCTQSPLSAVALFRLSPNCLSSLAPWKKSHPHRRPSPPSERDLTPDIASQIPPLSCYYKRARLALLAPSGKTE